MNGETVLEQDRPHVIKDVTDANLNDLLASLAQKVAWVLSMTRKGAVYTLNVAWKDQNQSPAVNQRYPAGDREHAPARVLPNLAGERNVEV